MNLFFDTSALVKLFHEEPGSDLVESLIFNLENEVWVLALVKVEFASSLHRRYRNHELTDKQLEIALCGFNEQLQEFNVEPMGASVLEEAERLLEQHGKLEGLRALDALQLAAFSLLQDPSWHFVCADRKLLQIANKIGFNVIDPVSPGILK